jgi:hypothetical protein
MISREDVNGLQRRVERLIEEVEELGYARLIGVDPKFTSEALAIERILSKVLRALKKAQGDLTLLEPHIKEDE